MRRHLMREFCPKAALFHYRESRLTSANCEDPQLRYLRLMRRKSTLNSALRRILRQTMRELFYNGMREENCGVLKSCALEKFNREFIRMLLNPDDEKIPYILELDDPHMRLSELQKRAERALLERAEKLEAGAFGQLLAVPVESRRRIAEVLSVTVNELCCYCAPLCAIENSGMLWIIESGAGGEESSLLHRFFGYNVLGRDPQNIRSFVLDDFSGNLQEVGNPPQISVTLRKISGDAARWDELLKCDIDNAPVNRENCSRCKFRPACPEGKGKI